MRTEENAHTPSHSDLHIGPNGGVEHGHDDTDTALV